MSWPLASFALVFGVLLIGWFAYERARPSARMVAVVATLSAAAALGREAFVALPEVKPITAMTFVVGYVLGPLPGFTVGAIGMLASNIMLGQGTYTPWQMAAWGLVGLLGAALGRLSHRRLSRVPLALACALAAVMAMAIMNLYTWTIGASHTLAALLATVASSLSFDITDVVSTLLFGLAFGPELARLLARVRARMDVTWVPAGTVAGSILVLGALAIGLPLSSGVARASGLPRTAAALPVAHGSLAHVNVSPELGYLAAAQDSDGGFGEARGKASSELYSAWAAMGLAAAGRRPEDLRRNGHSVLESLIAEASTLEGVGDDERTILALHACGAPVGSLAGHDLLAGVLGAKRADGSFSEQVNLTSFAIFALRAAGLGPSEETVRAAGSWIAQQQDRDGGFGFAKAGLRSDVDDTAAALQAMVDAGIRGGPGIARAVSYIVHAQNPDGGFPQEGGGESNAQSTSWAIQGLIAAGRDVEAVRDEGSRSPLGYLESLVAPDGSVRYSRTSAQSPVWVTAQALTALAGTPLPVQPVR